MSSVSVSVTPTCMLRHSFMKTSCKDLLQMANGTSCFSGSSNKAVAPFNILLYTYVVRLLPPNYI